jgi:hypothetical protein
MFWQVESLLQAITWTCIRVKNIQDAAHLTSYRNIRCQCITIRCVSPTMWCWMCQSSSIYNSVFSFDTCDPSVRLFWHANSRSVFSETGKRLVPIRKICYVSPVFTLIYNTYTNRFKHPYVLMWPKKKKCTIFFNGNLKTKKTRRCVTRCPLAL